MSKARTRGNGQGTVFKRGNTWYAQITVAVTTGKKQLRKTKGGFKTKGEAVSYLPKMRETPIAVAAPTITFAQLYDKWSAQHYPTIGKDGENGYRAAYAKCTALQPCVFADIKAADLQSVIDNAVSLQGKPLSARTKKDIQSLFCNLYKYALQNDIVSKDYSKFVTCPKREKPHKDAFTKEERDKLWKAYNNGDNFVGYILIMIYTGMRYGEISRVTIENIHLPEKYLIGGIKTEAGTNRTIPLHDSILPIIEKFCAENKSKLLEMPEKKWYSNYYAVLEKLGIRKMNPHCCRHTTGTALAEANVAPAIITAIMGHEDYATTVKNYTHLPLEDLINGINKI